MAACILGAAGIAASTVATAPAAHAAANGGCWTYYASPDPRNPRAQMSVTPCIKKASAGVVAPSAKFTKNTHWKTPKGCQIIITAVRAGDRKIMSRKAHACPTAATTNKVFTAPTFRATSGQYTTFVLVTKQDELTQNARSQFLKM
ncbi:hypothetical protein [Streptomyces sp. AM8-1-1]|uniref:hypothetical protein n=1 Tax=Streptomyces sp. AM8-1-1 TaxID=3075825 RepID=UPI0028C3F11B|nr:hypothetical protein [Streptomyces sp. AM8-1-1]WNO72381.1 hypothetical protein RPQ07_12405 [Streptomyces sp. AM8-1-1]